MLVIGAGAGGLVTAAGSRGLGAKVALIERTFLGGDCLVNGCVPSKAFIAAANVVHTIRKSS
jgi:pyruvate/2-oxoglutarate dehydrogenase complex dihydrolipoamide dehydrogenase (E3) component